MYYIQYSLPLYLPVLTKQLYYEVIFQEVKDSMTWNCNLDAVDLLYGKY